MHLGIAAMYLLLAIVIIFGIAWAICYVLRVFVPQIPPQVQNFVWIIAAILVIIKLIFFLGIVPGFAAEAPKRAPAIHRDVHDGGLHRDVQPFREYHGQPCVRRLPLLVCQPH